MVIATGDERNMKTANIIYENEITGFISGLGSGAKYINERMEYGQSIQTKTPAPRVRS
jgi:hypothetical protein